MKHTIPIIMALCVALGVLVGGAYALYGGSVTVDLSETASAENVTGSAVCSGSSVSLGGSGLGYSDGVIEVNADGVYLFTGEFDGYIHVTANSQADVTLILSGFTVNSDNAPAIYAKKYKTLTVTLAEGTENYLNDNRSVLELQTADISSSSFFCKTDLVVNGSGSLTISGNGDGIHAKSSITINGGTINISSGGQGINAATVATINDGVINVLESEEGIQAQMVVINGGSLDLVASDDGINATDGSGMDLSGNNAENVYIMITGGNIHINAGGDGVDSNGGLFISGGYTFVEGPTNDGNGILDYSSEATITGGTFIGIGSSGMLTSFGQNSTQGVIVNYLTETAEAGELQIVDSSGNVYETVTNTKKVAAYIYSSPEVTASETIGSGGMGGGGFGGGGFGGGGMGGFGGGGSRGGTGSIDPNTTGDNTTPTMPEGSTDGTVPTMPEGEDFTMPDGETPTMPEGGGTDGTMPTMPEGGGTGDGTVPAMPDGGGTGGRGGMSRDGSEGTTAAE